MNDKYFLLEDFQEFVFNVQIENRNYEIMPEWLEFYLSEIQHQIQVLLDTETSLSYDRIFEAFNLVQHAWDIWVTHIVLLFRERRPRAVISRLNSALRILKSSNTHAFRQLF